MRQPIKYGCPLNERDFRVSQQCKDEFLIALGKLIENRISNTIALPWGCGTGDGMNIYLTNANRVSDTVFVIHHDRFVNLLCGVPHDFGRSFDIANPEFNPEIIVKWIKDILNEPIEGGAHELPNVW